MNITFYPVIIYVKIKKMEWGINLKYFNVPNEKKSLIDTAKKEDKMIKTFESLSGSAIMVGEDVKELIKMADRIEGWRENADK
jgi:hypothetical protein